MGYRGSLNSPQPTEREQVLATLQNNAVIVKLWDVRCCFILKQKIAVRPSPVGDGLATKVGIVTGKSIPDYSLMYEITGRNSSDNLLLASLLDFGSGRKATCHASVPEL